ncbi:MAG: hypothetical protein ACRD0K_09260 [Egibacteraceae bacterium]
MADLMLEPSWWADRDAVEERRALVEAFRAATQQAHTPTSDGPPAAARPAWSVEDLEDATADLRERCEQLEHRRSSGQVVTGSATSPRCCWARPVVGGVPRHAGRLATRALLLGSSRPVGSRRPPYSASHARNAQDGRAAPTAVPAAT